MGNWNGATVRYQEQSTFQKLSHFRAYPHFCSNLLLSFALLVFSSQVEISSSLLKKLSVFQELQNGKEMELLNFYQTFLIDFGFHRRWSSAHLIFPGENYSIPICEYFSVNLLKSKASLSILCSFDNPDLNLGGMEPIIIFQFLEPNMTSILHRLLETYSSRRPVIFLTENSSLPQPPSWMHGRNYKWTFVEFNATAACLEISIIYGFAANANPSHLSQRIGRWGPDTGLELDASADFGPSTLQGHPIRITTLAGPPFVILNTNSNPLIATGYLPDLLNVLQLILNFSVVLMSPADEKYGDLDDSGNWTGMVGMLTRNEADLALTSFSYTKARRTVLDFSPPVEYSTTRLLIRRDQRPGGLKWDAFVRPFNLNVWSSILLIIFLGSATLTVFVKFQLFQASPAELFWLLSTCFLNQGQDEHGSVRVTPFRIVSGSFWLLAVFVFACYTARLTSFLAADSEKLPIADLEEAVTSSSWKIGVIKGSSILEKVKESDSQVMKLLWRRIQKDPSALAEGYANGVERVNRESYIFFASDLIPTYMVKQDCSYAWLPGKYFPGFGYMGYQKGLPYASSISRTLQRMREVGIVRRTFKSWWGTQTGCSGTGGGGDYPAVGLHEVGSALVVLIAGASLAVLFSVLELLCRTQLKFKFQH